MSAEDVEVVEKFLTSLTSGDVGGAMSCVADDLVLVEAGGMPHAGTYTGPDGIRALIAKVVEFFGRFELLEASYHDAGEFVVARVTVAFSSKDGERTVEMPVAEHYWVRHGKVSRVDAYYKNPGLLLNL